MHVELGLPQNILHNAALNRPNQSLSNQFLNIFSLLKCDKKYGKVKYKVQDSPQLSKLATYGPTCDCIYKGLTQPAENYNLNLVEGFLNFKSTIQFNYIILQAPTMPLSSLS